MGGALRFRSFCDVRGRRGGGGGREEGGGEQGRMCSVREDKMAATLAVSPLRTAGMRDLGFGTEGEREGGREGRDDQY